jgi:hypothetical protein
MITFFTTGKPYRGHDGIIQRNALKSWTLLHPDVEVIVFGDEDGAAEVCAEYGLRHEPYVERFESKLPYVNWMFARAQQIARHHYLCYSNCDIVQLPEFVLALEKLLALYKSFLMVARRWDTDVAQPIDFEREDWAKEIRKLALTAGYHQMPDFIDFFVFPKGFYDDVPPLLVGRGHWDHWPVWRALSGGLPVIDASRFVVPVHQNHTYDHHPQGKQGVNEDELAQRNKQLCGNGRHLRSMHDATHAMTRSGRIVWTPLRRQWNTLCEMRHKQGFLEHTFQLRNRLGLRRETLNKLRGGKSHARD